MREAVFYTLGYDRENGRHGLCSQGAYPFIIGDRQCTAANKITSGSKCYGEGKTDYYDSQ